MNAEGGRGRGLLVTDSVYLPVIADTKPGLAYFLAREGGGGWGWYDKELMMKIGKGGGRRENAQL